MIYSVKGGEAWPMPDSGPMQHNLLQETLKEGGGIPKQGFLSLAKQPREFELLKQYQNLIIINNIFP